jgi:hypothetical protein
MNEAVKCGRSFKIRMSNTHVRRMLFSYNCEQMRQHTLGYEIRFNAVIYSDCCTHDMATSPAADAVYPHGGRQQLNGSPT